MEYLIQQLEELNHDLEALVEAISEAKEMIAIKSLGATTVALLFRSG